MTLRMLKILTVFPITFLYTPCPHLYSCYASCLKSLPSLWWAEFWSPWSHTHEYVTLCGQGTLHMQWRFLYDLKIGRYRLFVWALHDYMCPRKQRFLLAKGTRGSQIWQKGKSEIWSMRSFQCATVDLMTTQACAKEKETNTTAAWS